MPRFYTRVATFLATLAVCFACGELADGQDLNWSNWRGPNHTGSLGDSSPPTTWDSETNVRWKTKTPGRGIGSPIVWEDQIVLLTAIDTGKPAEGSSNSEDPTPRDQARREQGQQEQQRGRGQERGGRRGRGRGSRGGGPPANIQDYAVVSFSASTGDELWRTVVATEAPHERGHNTNTFASSSAVTDGKQIFASFGSNGIFCLDMEGKLLWGKQLGKMQTRNQFGEGSSPAVFGNTLVVPWDHEGQSKLFALNTENGETQWTVERDEKTTWSTPLITEFDGRTEVITNGTTVRSYDLKTGQLLWSCGGQVTNPIPTPVRKDDFVVCMTGYRGNSIYAMELGGTGDIEESEKVLWNSSQAAPYVASPVLYDGQLYFCRERSGVISSVDVDSGEVKIPLTRLPGISDIYASPIAAGGKIYFMGRSGTTVVLKHGSEFEVLAVNELGESIDASAAILGDDLIIRGSEHLFRIGE